MAINFPTSPSVNDIHTDGDMVWKWDGSSWEAVIETSIPIPSQSGQAGEFLTTDGTTMTWEAVVTNPYDTATASTGYFDVPAGTTAQRPSTPATGNVRLNTTLLSAEIYNDSSWIPFAGSTPTISSIAPTTAAETGTTITVTGTNFQAGAVVAFIGTNLVSTNASSTTVDSALQITCTTPVLTVANEPYDVKVTNTNGGSATLSDILDAGGVPTWTTAAGNLGNIYNSSSGTHFTLVAGDPDSQAVTYAETTSVLSGVGLTLNSTTGAITGDPTDVGSSTTYNFTVDASDGVNTTSRAFSFSLHQDPTGGTITTATIDGQGYRIHTFTGADTFTTAIDVEVDILIVAGGASGGNRHGGGGGAGGLIHVVGSTIGAGSYTSTIGNGGARRVGTGVGYDGSNTTFVGTNSVSLTALGGGGGASYAGENGRNGGSGGGAGPYWGNVASGLSTATQTDPSMTGFTGGTGTGYGYRGGGNPGNHAVGGGGGAGAVGGDALDMGGGESSDQGGVGGVGLQINIDGNDYYWAGGGGGGGRRAYHAGAGGVGGGGGGGSEGLHGGTHGIGGGSAINTGSDGWHESNGGDAGANTGSGGGGQSQTGTEGYSGSTESGAGGSGIVIVRYKG